MKTKFDIILETLDAYSDPNNTAYSAAADSCVIETADGRNCALGRCMLRGYQKKFLEKKGPDLECVRHLDLMLQPEYRGHSVSFWKALQNFHDAIGNSGLVSTVTKRWDALLEELDDAN